MRLVFICVLCFILSACATNHSTSNNQAWRGQSADLLMKQQGAPAAIVPAQNGNTLFVYVTRVPAEVPTMTTNTTPTMVGPQGQAFSAALPPPPGTGNMVVKCSTTYEVNKQRQIMSVKTEGAC